MAKTKRNSTAKGFLLYKDFHSQIQELSVEQAGHLIKAVFAFHANEDYVVDDPVVNFALKGLLSQFERDAIKYAETCAKRSVSGTKGAKQKLANAGKRKLKLANLADRERDRDKDRERNRERKTSAQPVYTENFNIFWKEYKKGNKKSAFEAWKKEVHDQETFDKIMAAVGPYKDYCASADRPMKDGQGWLNGRYWENEWTHEAQGTKPAKPDTSVAVSASKNPEDYTL